MSAFLSRMEVESLGSVQELSAAKSGLEQEQQRVKELEGHVADRDVRARMCALLACLFDCTITCLRYTNWLSLPRSPPIVFAVCCVFYARRKC